MAVKRISRHFKDISLSFEPHPVTKDIPVLTNERAIVRSVRNLVETTPTERPFNSLLGSEVRSSLFDFVDFGTAAVIQDQIETAITNYEPRIEISEVLVDPNYDANQFDCTITYMIVGIDVPPTQLEFALLPSR